MVKIIDKPNNLMWKEINRIGKYNSATRLWRYRNRNNIEYKNKKKLQDKIYNDKVKHLRKYVYHQRKKYKIKKLCIL